MQTFAQGFLYSVHVRGKEAILKLKGVPLMIDILMTIIVIWIMLFPVRFFRYMIRKFKEWMHKPAIRFRKG